MTTLSFELSDNDLLHRMLMRDGAAWRLFHTRYDRLIYRCIHKVVGRFSQVVGSEDVREIYATLLCSLVARDMHKLRTFAPERGNKLSTWIGMLATNCAWDHLRQLARQPASELDDEAVCPSEDPFELASRRERWARLNALLETFSTKDRTFVQLFYVDGLSPEEIADEMQISVKTVYSKKHKIRSRLEQLAGTIQQAA